MLKNLKSNFFLIKSLTYREIESQYKGSILGMLWVFLTPMIMLLIFTFVFGEIFQAKWQNTSNSSGIEFSLNLFIGLSLFWLFSDFLNRAPKIFTSNPNYIKKVVFPLEVLPFVTLFSVLFRFFIYLFIILVLLSFSEIGLTLNVFYLLFIILDIFPLLLGLGFLLASLGVYIRDIVTMIGLALNAMMFLSPIFYPLNAIPENFRWLFNLNPLSHLIEESRTILIHGNTPNITNIIIYFLISSSIFYLGYKTFKITKKGFADVL